MTGRRCGGCSRDDVPRRPGCEFLPCAHVATSGLPCVSSWPQVADYIAIARQYAINDDGRAWMLASGFE